MQVGNIGSDKIAASRKKRKISDGSFSISENEAETETKSVNQTKVNVNSLWQLQAFDDWSVDVDNMQENGGKLLEELNNLRMCLLNEELEKEDIESLAEALENTELDLKYPELQEALDDVRLRAAVELAKIS